MSQFAEILDADKNLKQDYDKFSFSVTMMDLKRIAKSETNTLDIQASLKFDELVQSKLDKLYHIIKRLEHEERVRLVHAAKSDGILDALDSLEVRALPRAITVDAANLNLIPIKPESGTIYLGYKKIR